MRRLRNRLRQPLTSRQFIVAMTTFVVFFVGMEIKIYLIQRDTMRHLDHINATFDEMDKDFASINASLDHMLDGGGP
jgi:hypothetical protein